MILATDLTGFPAKRFPKLVLALGVFDGLHLGHRAILRKVHAEAKKIGGHTAVLTFREHPQNVLQPRKRTELLTSFWHKISLIELEGIDLCIVLKFSHSFSNLPADAFVRRILVEKLGVKTVVLGHDSHFGHNREGNAGLMERLAIDFGFRVVEVPPLRAEGGTVSSTRIRKLIADGRLPQAERLLGRSCSVVASVVKGSGRGRQLGFPTANLNPHSEILPPNGVYAARVKSFDFSVTDAGKGLKKFRLEKDFSTWPAVMNLGTRPTFEKTREARVPEAHLLRFKGNLYGKTLEVSFLKRLRPERKFQSQDALQAQILRDMRQAKLYF